MSEDSARSVAFDLPASVTFDVPPEVIKQAREDYGFALENGYDADFEAWLVNHTTHDVTVTVDGEPLENYLAGGER